MRLSFCPVFLLLLWACADKERGAPAQNKKPFRVLSYSSMTGDGSLGALIESVYEKSCLKKNDASLSCELTMLPENGDAGLVSSFLKSPQSFDAILGLESLQVAQLRENSPVVLSELFARGPHAFIVDTSQWNDPKKWPTSWKELSKFPTSAYMQDPRVSSVGIGWIKAIFVHQLIELPLAKKITKKVFPSWSLSYSAFQKGGAPLVWSYQSSEAYHLCEEKSERYKALPLAEGYPVQEEFVVIPSATLSPEAKLFAEVVASNEIQSQVPLKNWMWPASTKTVLPDCFKAVTPVKTLEDKNIGASSKKLREWMDAWSL